MKTYSSEGIVIARRNFSEADRIVVLFTKDFGKISLIAKGVRKLTSRKRGGIEVFNKIKFSAVKGKSLDILTEVQVISSPSEAFKKDLRRVTVGYYFCEVLGRITRDGEKQIQVFDILQKYFDKLENSRNLKLLRLEFVREVLVAVGFWPEDKPMGNPDAVLENIIERKINSTRVGKRILTSD